MLHIRSKTYTDIQGRTGTVQQGSYFSPNTLDIVVEYDTTYYLDDLNYVIKHGNDFILTGDWSDLIGVTVGSNIDFVLGSGSAVSTTVTFVDGDTLRLLSDGGFADGTYSEGYFENTDDPEGFEFYYNQVKNNSAGTVYSINDGEAQRFKVELDNALSVSGTDSFVQLGKKSGGSIMTADITRETDISGKKVYTISLDYKLWGINEADYIADDCFGDYFEVLAFPTFADRSKYLKTTQKQRGNTGYEDEANNGGTANYSLQSIVWEDASANVLEAFDYSQSCDFTINILGNFTANHEFNVLFYQIPQDETLYKNTVLPIENNLLLVTNSALIPFATPTNINGATGSGDELFQINSFTATNNTTYATITGTVVPNDDVKAMLAARDEGDLRYKMLIVVSDTSLSYAKDDTVNVLVEDTQMVKDVRPLGNYPDLASATLYRQDSVAYSSSPTISLMSRVYANVQFTLPKSTTENPWLTMGGRVVAERTDGERFTLESFSYDVSQLPAMPDGTLTLNYLQSRGYQLSNDDLTGYVSVDRKPSLDTGGDFGVEINYGFQIDYRDWEALPYASDYFYGNKTKNWYTYSSDAEWDVKFEFFLSNEDGEYIDELPFTVQDYDSSATISTTVSFLDENGDVATGLLFNQQMTIVAEHVATTNWAGNEYGSIMINSEDGAPLWEINTDEVPVSGDNPLYPESGETKLKISVVGDTMTLTCMVDTSKLSNNQTISTVAKGDTV